MLRKIFFSVLIIFFTVGLYYKNTVFRLYQGLISIHQSKERAKYYLITDNSLIHDITDLLISDKTIPEDLKQPLIKGERRIIVFKYPSDSEYVAGYFSYLTKGVHPTIIFLRGGNGFFGIMRPNNRFSFLSGYNVVGTLYRGNIYGGIDELGGKDIHDVENLIKFFTQLEQFTHCKMSTPYAMLGVSRGAMQMFSSLSQSSYVKSKVNRAISVSGDVDLRVNMQKRPEMSYLFKSHFKNSQLNSFDEWIKNRNPADNATNLSKSLKVLLIYGLADERVSLEEQQSFKNILDKKGISCRLVTIPNANHGLDDHYEEFEKISINFLQ